MSQRLRGEKSENVGKVAILRKVDQNIVMNEELVKNSAMNVKINPKVAVALSIFKIGGWNHLQPTNQYLLE